MRLLKCMLFTWLMFEMHGQCSFKLLKIFQKILIAVTDLTVSFLTSVTNKLFPSVQRPTGCPNAAAWWLPDPFLWLSSPVPAITTTEPPLWSSLTFLLSTSLKAMLPSITVWIYLTWSIHFDKRLQYESIVVCCKTMERSYMTYVLQCKDNRKTNINNIYVTKIPYQLLRNYIHWTL